MQEMLTKYPVTVVSRVLGIVRSACYVVHCRKDRAPLREALKRIAGQWPTYGYRRLTAMLHREGISVNHKLVLSEMHILGIVQRKRRRMAQTTNSRHGFARYPNALMRTPITHPDHCWVADITYVQLHGEWIYLAVLMDVFSRTIRGWALSRRCDEALAIEALQKALAMGRRPAIHHSDQGVQYAAKGYTALLRTHAVTISMAACGEPQENGFAERVMRTIKEEHVALTEYENLSDARRQIGQFLEDVYNSKRIHSSLGYRTPVEFEESWRQQQKVSDTVPTVPHN